MKMPKLSFASVLQLCLLPIPIYATNVYALAFNIYPKAGTSLPTFVIPGQTVTAYYTVSNNTSSVRENAFVKYLPPHTTQNFTDATYSDICQSSFTLNPKGTAGDSCTLKLIISGEIFPCNNCDPHQCLFVCEWRGATCAGTNYPLVVAELPSNSCLVSVGFYDGPNLLKPFSHNQIVSRALAYTSANYGLTWANGPVPVVGVGDAFLYGVNCTGTHCVAVGSSTDAGTNKLSSTFVSNDCGTSWTSTPPPAVATPNEALSVSCAGNNCVSVGYSSNNALSYYSIDGGVSWTQSSPSTPPGGFTQLNGVSCTTSACTAVGFYNNGSVNTPVAYTSTNAGVSWSAPILLTKPINTQARLNGVSCSGTNCVACGVLISPSINTALLYTSNDSGNTWSSPITPPPPPVTVGSDLKGVFCEGANCIAVGFYQLNPSNASPLAYFSSDGGGTWLQAPVTLFGSPEFLESVSCIGNICNAVGFYTDLSGTRKPVTYHSTDYGHNWSAAITPPYQGTLGSALYGVSSGAL